MKMAKVPTTEQVKKLAQQMRSQVDSKLSSIYRPGGSVAFAGLPAADAEHLGMVYNVTDAFTASDSFLEGAGQRYPAGTNIAVVTVDGGYKYDVLAGLFDTSGLVQKEAGKGLSTNDFTNEDKAKLDGIEITADAEFDAMLNEVFGAE